MEKQIANALSYITHPLLVPLLGLLVISNSGTYAADMDIHYRQFIYISVFIMTFLLPAGLIPLFLYSGLAKSINFSERKERLVPLYVTLVFYVAAYFFIRKLPISQIYQRFMFSASLSVLLVLAVSYFWKISAHTVAWGGLVGLIWSITLRFETDLMLFLVISLICSGFVGFARLRLGEHNPLQVFAGFLLGFLVMLAVFFI
ncbi:MAG: phosphatase PAP2 family protein [Bacteroidales bacterium]|nr:phosphatase PAP2 family protein [Bacteroidales bacterium]